MDIKLGQTVYHTEIYQAKEAMKVVGLRVDQIELQGDYSGGTHNVCQTGWMPLKGIELSKNTAPWTWGN